MDKIAAEFINDPAIKNANKEEVENFLKEKGLTVQEIQQLRQSNQPSFTSECLVGGMGILAALWDKLIAKPNWIENQLKGELHSHIKSTETSINSIETKLAELVTKEKENAASLEEMKQEIQTLKTLIPTVLKEAERIKQFQDQQIMQELASLRSLFQSAMKKKTDDDRPQWQKNGDVENEINQVSN